MDNSSKSRLNKEQLEAATHLNGPMLVVAGPGSGKTHLLIERIYNLTQKGIPPENILVITFSKKAALEMQGRFQKRITGKNSNVLFGTFHAVFFGILKYHGLYSFDSILNNKDKFRIIEEAAISLHIDKGFNKKWQLRLLEEISFYKNSGDRLFADDSGFFLDEEGKEEFRKVYKKYTDLCRKYKKLDFDDMVTECKDLLNRNTEIRLFWQKRFRYILVDEFQDINKAQYEVLKLLEGNEKNIFAVGDDDQSIYGFRGSEPGIMKTFLNDHENAGQVFLKLNYRCCYQVVDAADSCIKHNKDRLSRPRQLTLKNRPPGKVIIENFENENDESVYVVNEIKKLIDEAKYENIAIIYRSEHCASVIEEKIRIGEIPYDKKEKPFVFYSLLSVSVIISYFKAIIDKASINDYLNILNYPYRNISRESLISFQNINENSFLKAETVLSTIHEYYKEQCMPEKDDRISKLDLLFKELKMLNDFPPQAALVYLLKKTGLRDGLRDNYKKVPAYPFEFEELISELKSRLTNFKCIEGFLEYAEGIKAADNYNNGGKKEKKKLTFITAHASKGLEYDVVFIVGLQEGLFPHRKNLKEPGIEEERRLFYVAMTRAKERLYIIGRGSLYGKRTSRFLNEITNDQSFIASNSSLSRNSSNASATASYSSSSSIYESSGSALGSDSSSE